MSEQVIRRAQDVSTCVYRPRPYGNHRDSAVRFGRPSAIVSPLDNGNWHRGIEPSSSVCPRRCSAPEAELRARRPRSFDSADALTAFRLPSITVKAPSVAFGIVVSNPALARDQPGSTLPHVGSVRVDARSPRATSDQDLLPRLQQMGDARDAGRRSPTRTGGCARCPTAATGAGDSIGAGIQPTRPNAVGVPS